MVYLLHFDKKFSHIQHYIGFTKDLDKRMEYHKNGNGSKLLNALNKNNINYNIVRTWDEDGNFERRLKHLKNAPKLCPICNVISWRKNGVFEK